jgi:predicted Zn finger-like uncharacterized protein
MRTIKNPNQRVKCPKCNAELEIERDDIRLDDTGMYPAFHVLCPHCSKAIDVSQEAKVLGASA